MEPWRTAASSAGIVAFDAVAFVDLDEVLADVSLLVLDETRWVNRDTALAITEANLRTLAEPRREPLLGVWRQEPNGRYARDHCRDLAHHRPWFSVDDLVRHRSSCCGGLAEQVGPTHHLRGGLRARRLDAVLMLHRIGTQHESREIKLPLVQLRDIWAVDVAEFALEALVDDLVLLSRGHSARVAVVVPIDHLEQRRERRAKLEAQPAAMTQVIDARQFPANVSFVEIERMLGVVRDRHSGASSGRPQRAASPSEKFSCVLVPARSGMEVLRLRNLREFLRGKIGPPPRQRQLIEPAIQARTDVTRKGPPSGVRATRPSAPRASTVDQHEPAAVLSEPHAGRAPLRRAI